MLVAKVINGLRSRPWSEIRDYGVIFARHTLGLPNRLPTPDRDTLEQIILPSYARRDDIRSILFVGADWYTAHYAKMFPGRTYWTMDIDPWKRRFGARRHVVAGMQEIDKHFAPGSLDLVVCNGVFGWGLDDRVDCERAFQGCFDALRPAGELLVGWNDRPERRPLALSSLASLARFAPLEFEALGTTQHLANVDNMHTFNFYIKP